MGIYHQQGWSNHVSGGRGVSVFFKAWVFLGLVSASPASLGRGVAYLALIRRQLGVAGGWFKLKGV